MATVDGADDRPGIVLGRLGPARSGGYQAFARRAVEGGYGRLWLPETSLADPVSFAGWLAAALPGHPIGLGVLPAALRSGPQLAMIAATLRALGVDDLQVVVGTSSATMTRNWHGREPATTAAVEALVRSTRAAASGQRTEESHGPWPTVGFTNGLGPVPLHLGLAAFGPLMLRLAGRVADSVALNFVAPAAVHSLLAAIDEGARAVGRARPAVTVWTHVTVDPSEETRTAARRFLATYLRVPGYDRVLAAQGFADLVERASWAGSAREVQSLVPDEMLASVLGFGDRAAARARLDAYRELGVAVAVQPATLGPAAVTEATLEALAPTAR